MIFVAVQEDMAVITELKNEVDQQRHRARKLERELKEKTVDVDAVRQIYSYINIAFFLIFFSKFY